MSANAHRRPFPPLDERLVEPEQGVEVVRGEVIEVTQSKVRHAWPHARLAALLNAHVVDGYLVAVELLARVAEDGDFAADVCVRPLLDDPDEIDRLLDELSFEIVSTQSRSQVRKKAEDRTLRGVRRTFAIDVRRGQVLEWDSAEGKLVALAPSGEISDRLLKRPLRVSDLVSWEPPHDAVAEGMLVDPPPVLQAALATQRQNGRAEGRTEGRAEVLALLTDQVIARLKARGIPMTAAQRTTLEAQHDVTVVGQWLALAERCTQVEELLALAAPDR